MTSRPAPLPALICAAAPIAAAEPPRRLPRIDRVLLATAAILVGLALKSPAQAIDTLRFVLASAAGIGPFLLASVLSAGWLRAAGADRSIGLAFRARPAAAIVLAAAFGALSPLCSCGVIPLIAALLLSGVPLAPVMAFWIASPVMAPDMYLITAGALGFEFATAKAIAAVAIGMLAGFATWPLQRQQAFARPLRRRIDNGAGSEVLAGSPVQWRFWRSAERLERFWRESLRSAGFLAKWLLLAFVLESLMLAWLPADAVSSWVGDNALAIPLAALIGVPSYVNGYAAVPVVAGLLQSGMAPGAAMSFMTAGAMTSLPAALAVFSLVRGQVFAWYLLLALALSMLSGYGYAAWLA
jgi:uncharacterized protein